MKKKRVLSIICLVLAAMTSCGYKTDEEVVEIHYWIEEVEDYKSKKYEIDLDKINDWSEFAKLSECLEEAQRLAFSKVLWDVYQKGILPDGKMLDYISMEDAAANGFSITDIDGDGQEELLLSWINASMSGMTEYVFGYKDGVVYVELAEFPGMSFYDNSAVEAGWSHNQGLAGTFWPYDAYCYDAENDIYQFIGAVDAWDKRVREKNYNGESFPTEIDVDGDGVVYYLLPADWDGNYDESRMVDGADYEKWRDTYLNGAEEISISFQKLTEENISILGYPKPDDLHSQPKG